MPWAHDNVVSTDPIDGGIEITAEQYGDAIAGMQDGKRVAVVDGALVIQDPPPPASPEEAPPVDETNPANFPLSMRQLRLALFASGRPVNFIQLVINAIPDAVQQAQAQIWYEESSEVHWEHPETQALIAASGIAPAEARQLWLAAKNIL